MASNERLREIRSIVNMINGMKGGPVDSDRAFLLARLDEVVKLAREILEAFAKNEDGDIAKLSEIIEELKADKGYGYRRYTCTVTDAQLVKWIACLAELEKGE